MDINSLRISTNTSILEKQVQSASKNEDDDALMEVCKEFESIFLSMMFKEMKKTVPDDGLFEKSLGTEIFEDMYIDTLSQEVTKENSYGIAKMLYEQFKNGYVNL